MPGQGSGGRPRVSHFSYSCERSRADADGPAVRPYLGPDLAISTEVEGGKGREEGFAFEQRDEVFECGIFFAVEIGTQ